MDLSMCVCDNEEVYNTVQIAKDLDQHATEGNQKNYSKDFSIQSLQESIQSEISSKIENKKYQPVNENDKVSQKHLTNLGKTKKEGNVDENIIATENTNNKTFIKKEYNILDEDFDRYSCKEMEVIEKREGNFTDYPLKICIDSLDNFMDGKDEKVTLNLSKDSAIFSNFEDQMVKDLVLEPQFTQHKSLNLRDDERISNSSDQINIKKYKSLSSEIFIDNNVKYRSIHVPEKSFASYIDNGAVSDLIIKQVLKKNDDMEPFDFAAEVHVERNIKNDFIGQIQKEISRYNETELSKKFDSMIINENKSNILVKNKEYQNEKTIKNNSRDVKFGQEVEEREEIKEIKTTIMSDNILKIATQEKCKESYDDWNNCKLKEDGGETQESETSENILPNIFDSTPLSQEVEQRKNMKEINTTIMSDNILKIATQGKCEVSHDDWNHCKLKEDVGEKQESETSEKVLPNILDSTPLSQKMEERKEIKEIKTTIMSDNILESATQEKWEESHDNWNHCKLKEDEGVKQERETSEKVLRNILDSTTSDRKYVTEKREIFQDKQSEIKSKNNLVYQQIINTINFEEIAKTNDMNYRLNPNAKEFIPTSPPDFAILTNGYPKFQQRFDDVVAQSPRKSTINMEDIHVPEEEMFDKEAAIRPHEVNEEIIISKQTPTQCGILFADELRNVEDACNNSKKVLGVFEENINSSDQGIKPENEILSVVFTAMHELNDVDMSRTISIRKSDESDLLNSIQAIPDEDDTIRENEITSSRKIEVANEKFDMELINKTNCSENIQQINIPIKEDCLTENDDGSKLYNSKVKGHKNEEKSAKSNDIAAKLATRHVFPKTNNIQLRNESSRNDELKTNKGTTNTSKLYSKKAIATVKDMSKNKSDAAISSKSKSNILVNQSTKTLMTARPRSTLINSGEEKNKSQTSYLITKINLKSNETLLLNKKTTSNINNKHLTDNNTLRTAAATKNVLLKHDTETKSTAAKSFLNAGKNKTNKTLSSEIPSRTSQSRTMHIKNSNLQTSLKNKLPIQTKTEANKSASKPGRIASRLVVNTTKNLGSAAHPNCKVKKDSSEKIENTMMKKSVSSVAANTAKTRSKTLVSQSTTKNLKYIEKETFSTTNEEFKTSDKFSNKCGFEKKLVNNKLEKFNRDNSTEETKDISP